MGLNSIVVAIWGAEKSCKTTLALTFPRPIVHFDLDVGGFARAAWRIDNLEGIDSESYPTPIQMEKLMGVQKTGVSIKFPKKVIGVKETWQRIVTDYVEAIQKPEVKTIIIDSATQLWGIDHRSYLQELQERQVARNPKITENELRENLMPKEYGEPNDRMRTLIYTARSFGKNLVLTHYPTDVYAERVGDKGVESYKTGDVKLDGFKETERLVDLVLYVYTKENSARKNTPYAKVTVCGLPELGLDAVDMVLPEFSYDGVFQLHEFVGKKVPV